jgi:hypothetical protein
MLKLVWGEEKWVGLSTNLYADWIITDGTLDKYRSYNYKDLDVFGCQALLTISPGRQPFDSSSILLSHYYYYRFVRPDGMDMFLDGVTKVTVNPFHSMLAKNCRQ